jgi:hypothetical protein
LRFPGRNGESQQKTPKKTPKQTPKPKPKPAPVTAPVIACGDRLCYGSVSGASLYWKAVAVTDSRAYLLSETSISAATHSSLNTAFQTLKASISFSPQKALISLRLPTAADTKTLSLTSTDLKGTGMWWLADSAQEGIAPLIDNEGSITAESVSTKAGIRLLLEIDKAKTVFEAKSKVFRVVP